MGGTLDMAQMDATMQRLSLDSLWFDATLAALLHAVNNSLFAAFHRDGPRGRRLLTLLGFVAATVGLSALAGRGWALGFLALSTALVFYVHAVWLPNHGVNGWTAEPRERYLALLRRKDRA